MNARQYDDLDRHDIQNIIDSATAVVQEVEMGSGHYTPEEYRHAQDVQRELATVETWSFIS